MMMIKKLSQFVLLLFIATSFLYCVDEEPNPILDADAASKLEDWPIADAGPDIVISLPTNSVQLDGSRSVVRTTADKITNYQWSKILGPSSYTITSPSSAITNVTNLTEGSYTFRLTVTNTKGNKSYNNVDVRVTSTGLAATTSSITSTGNLFFSGNMNNVTISSGHLGFNGWDQLKTHPHVKYLHLNNIGAAPYAYQQIVKDPASGANVMAATVIDDDPNWSGTTRAQTTIAFKDGVNLPVYHTSHRMFLSPDIAHLANMPDFNHTWFTLYEIWNKARSGDNSAGSSRWTLYMKKTSANKLFLRLDAQRTPGSEQITMWQVDNTAFVIPFGKWATWDVYFKRGAGSAGQYKLTVTVDGQQPVVVFDVRKDTILPGDPSNPVASINPFKLYGGDVLYNWMRANGKKITANYNDFVWYKD